MASSNETGRIYGPDGHILNNSQNLASHDLVRPGFNDHSEVVEITPEEEFIGRKTHEIYTTKLHRQLRWLIKEGKIVVRKPSSLEQKVEHAPEAPDLPEIETGLIITEGLEREQLSSALSAVTYNFKRVEDKLPDYTGRATQQLRNIWGMQLSSLQWGHEEGQHSEADGLIIVATGYVTPQELQDDYYLNLRKTWEQPFPTVREMVAYTVLQELMTGHAYSALAREALRQEAPITAQIFRLIASDELYHYGGYKEYLWVFAEQDLEGTIADTIHVAENFRMPSQNLLPDPQKALLDAVRMKVFSRKLVAEDTIYKGLMALKFIPEPLARATADKYWNKEN